MRSRTCLLVWVGKALWHINNKRNSRLSKALKPSNAALVKRTVEVCEKYERPAATYMQAREILGLRPFTS